MVVPHLEPLNRMGWDPSLEIFLFLFVSVTVIDLHEKRSIVKYSFKVKNRFIPASTSKLKTP